MATRIQVEQELDTEGGRLRHLRGLMGEAERAVTNHEAAVVTLKRRQVNVVRRMRELADVRSARAREKAAATVRLMEQGYTPTKAGDLTRVDQQYDQYKMGVERAENALAEAEQERDAAELDVEQAKLTAEMALTLVKAEGGLS